MSDDLLDIGAPAAASAAVTRDQLIHGPAIPPQQRILLYSPDEWEKFIEEWAHFALKTQYVQVQRFGGAGDKGLDVIGFTDPKKLDGVWDNYQCKRFVGRVVYPTDAWPEFGKILWYSFRKEYTPPRKYYLVAPKGIGTTLASLLANSARLKRQLFENWDKHVKNAISEKQEVPLTGSLAEYVDAFDFSSFDSKSPLQVVEDHRSCPCHAARFGGGLPRRPAAPRPPAEVAPAESRYVAQLLSAYADHKKRSVPNVKALAAWPPLEAHFGRQREAFYEAESLRVFARDSVPAGTFESLQSDIHTGVIDVCDAEHSDGFERVKQVTRAAREVQITSNGLIGSIKPKDRDGVCHQLANEDRLRWMRP